MIIKISAKQDIQGPGFSIQRRSSSYQVLDFTSDRMQLLDVLADVLKTVGQQQIDAGVPAELACRQMLQAWEKIPKILNDDIFKQIINHRSLQFPISCYTVVINP